MMNFNQTLFWKAAAGLLIFGLLFAGCTAADDGPAADRPGEEAAKEAEDVDEGTRLHDAIAAQNRFGFLLHEALRAAAAEDDNVFVSPTSVAVAMGMALTGAAGDTASALAAGLQLEGWTRDEVSEAHRQLLELLDAGEGTSGVELHIANGLWHALNFSPAPEFLEATARDYGATTRGLDFSDPASVDVINEWVAAQTEHLIDNLVETLDPGLVAMLVNTVYFNGRWSAPFDPAFTAEDVFHTASGEERTVPFMYRDGRFEHKAGSGFDAVRLPYGEERRLAMYIFLPDEGADRQELLASLLRAEGLFDGFVNKRGEVRIPRLHVSYKAQLNRVLADLGMGVAFDPVRADFRNMAAAPDPSEAGDARTPERLYIDNVVHQSVLKVDEEGTEAAAATSVGIRMTSAPAYEFRFTADRPFFMAIRDDATGALLFLGTIADAG